MPDWSEVFRAIQERSAKSNAAADEVRREYLASLAAHTKRNVIAYYSAFLSKPNLQLLDINDEDVNGFMMAVHKLDRSRGLDLVLHTPGGSIASTESIVHYLQIMFDRNIRVIVPQIAMSAGTMIACPARQIVLGKQSSLGPIDPQLRGIPAQGVINEFKRALIDLKEDASYIHVWQPILQQYRPTFLGQCQQAIDWTRDFVTRQLTEVMFYGDGDAAAKASSIVAFLSDDGLHKAHERHIPLDECVKIGLRVLPLESDQQLQDLVLTVHHCYMFAMMNSPALKIIENHTGESFIKAQSTGRQ
ncbi:MAG: SDH family Clp fold serine proteinase [Terriglobales bacterium]